MSTPKFWAKFLLLLVGWSDHLVSAACFLSFICCFSFFMDYPQLIGYNSFELFLNS